jgi:hypothetical protein
MRNYSGVLVVVGSLCLTITLVLAWCLLGVRTSARVRKLFPNVPNLLKAHIDYLLMTGLLMIFYLLFAHFQLSMSPVILVAMSVGSLMNLLEFLVLAIKPDTKQIPASPFSAIMATSFALTMVGYAGQLGPLRTSLYSQGDRKEPT